MVAPTPWKEIHGGDRVNWKGGTVPIKSAAELEALISILSKKTSDHWGYNEVLGKAIDPHQETIPVDRIDYYVFKFKNPSDAGLLGEHAPTHDPKKK
jgi:hypothetical protein